MRRLCQLMTKTIPFLKTCSRGYSSMDLECDREREGDAAAVATLSLALPTDSSARFRSSASEALRARSRSSSSFPAAATGSTQHISYTTEKHQWQRHRPIAMSSTQKSTNGNATVSSP